MAPVVVTGAPVRSVAMRSACACCMELQYVGLLHRYSRKKSSNKHKLKHMGPMAGVANSMKQLYVVGYRERNVEYNAMQLNRDTEEPAKVLLQTKKNALLPGSFKETEKILVQRITAKKEVVPVTPPPI